MAKDNENVQIKISVCENISDNKIIILCSPKNKDFVENILTLVEDDIEETGDNFPDLPN